METGKRSWLANRHFERNNPAITARTSIHTQKTHQGADLLGLLDAPPAALAADAAFAAFLAAAAAAVAAQAAPKAARNRHAAEQVQAEREFYR